MIVVDKSSAELRADGLEPVVARLAGSDLMAAGVPVYQHASSHDRWVPSWARPFLQHFHEALRGDDRELRVVQLAVREVLRSSDQEARANELTSTLLLGDVDVLLDELRDGEPTTGHESPVRATRKPRRRRRFGL